MPIQINPNDILVKAETLRNSLSTGFRDEIVKSLYSEAENIARRAVKTANDKKYDFDQKVDRIVTSPITGLPIMLFLLGLIIYVPFLEQVFGTAALSPNDWLLVACPSATLWIVLEGTKWVLRRGWLGEVDTTCRLGTDPARAGVRRRFGLFKHPAG